jgi:cytochrome P450
VDEVSIELTTMMLATLFNFPWEDRRKLTFWSDVAICTVDAPGAPRERFAELLRMADVFNELWKERATAPPRLDPCVGDRFADLQLRILWEEILARNLSFSGRTGSRFVRQSSK